MLDDAKLASFVQADLTIRQLEWQLEEAKAARRKAEEYLLDQMGMEGQTQALVDISTETYKVYTRRTTALRVTNLAMALGSLRLKGLSAFIDERVDTGRLGSYYKKHENAQPDLEGLQYSEVFRLYAIQRR